MSILVYFLWSILFFFAIASPPVALIFYGFIGSDSDAFGVANFLSSSNASQKLVTRGLYLLAFLISLRKILLIILKKTDKILIYNMILALLLSSFIFFNSIIKDLGVIKSLSILTYSGLPGFLIWLTTAGDKRYRNLFFVYVSLNIIIAVSVLFFPFLEPINGRNYQLLNYLSSSIEGGVNFSIPDLETNKYYFVKYGQYHNPNALGFYACVAIICGFSLAFRQAKVRREKYIGIYLSILGFIAWLNSLTRGPAMAIIFICIVWMFIPNEINTRKSKQLTKRFGKIMLSFLFVIFALLGLYQFLFVGLSDISIVSRLEGYKNGFEAIVNYPLLGIDSNWDWPGAGSNPHFLPLSFAAHYGIFSGILVATIVFGFGFYAILRAFKSSRKPILSCLDRSLGIGLILVVWSIASTNNLAAVVLFWVCLAEAYIRIFTTTKENT